MEMETISVNLPPKIMEKFIEELNSMDCSLINEKPISCSAFRCVYKTQHTVTRELSVCKVTVISEDLPLKVKEDLVKVVQEEVKVAIRYR